MLLGVMRVCCDVRSGHCCSVMPQLLEHTATLWLVQCREVDHHSQVHPHERYGTITVLGTISCHCVSLQCLHATALDAVTSTVLIHPAC
jgi:hypothetical protein